MPNTPSDNTVEGWRSKVFMDIKEHYHNPKMPMEHKVAIFAQQIAPRPQSPNEYKKLEQEIKDFTKAIHSLTTQARIEELENLTGQYGEFRDETMGEPITLKAVTLYRIKHRINTLKGQL